MGEHAACGVRGRTVRTSVCSLLVPLTKPTACHSTSWCSTHVSAAGRLITVARLTSRSTPGLPPLRQEATTRHSTSGREPTRTCASTKHTSPLREVDTTGAPAACATTTGRGVSMASEGRGRVASRAIVVAAAVAAATSTKRGAPGSSIAASSIAATAAMPRSARASPCEPLRCACWGAGALRGVPSPPYGASAARARTCCFRPRPLSSRAAAMTPIVTTVRASSAPPASPRRFPLGGPASAALGAMSGPDILQRAHSV